MSFNEVRVSLITAIVVASTIGWTFLLEPSGAYRHDKDPERYADLALQEAFQPVGYLKRSGERKASGVLVAPRWVATAAHSTEKAESVSNLSFVVEGKSYPVERVVYLPERQSDKSAAYDLALMQLQETVENVQPAEIYSDSDAVGKVGVAVGYGTFQNALPHGKDELPAGVKRAGTNAIDAAGGSGSEYSSEVIMADFDHPEDTTTNVLGSPEPTDLEFMPMGGDSGGGLFVETNADEWRLVGIYSRFSVNIQNLKNEDIGFYGNVVRWTRLSSHREWMRSKLGTLP